MPVSATQLSTSLSQKQRLALAFQTITRWTRILLETWADWFVQRTTDIEKEMRDNSASRMPQHLRRTSWAPCCTQPSICPMSRTDLVIDFLQKMNWEPISAWNKFSFFFYVGDAGNTSLVDAGTLLGATAVVTPGSAGYLLWECCILVSL